MPLGIINHTTNITLKNITKLGNFTDPVGFFTNVNEIVYGGYLYFILLWVMLIIMYLALQQREDQPLTNIMYSSAIVTILSFFYRAIEITQSGITRGMLTDYQMWIFPLISAVCITLIWLTREDKA